MISETDNGDIFEGKYDCSSILGFKNVNESDVWVHSSLMDITNNDSVVTWCNLYFDDISDGVFQISCILK